MGVYRGSHRDSLERPKRTRSIQIYLQIDDIALSRVHLCIIIIRSSQQKQKRCVQSRDYRSKAKTVFRELNKKKFGRE